MAGSCNLTKTAHDRETFSKAILLNCGSTHVVKVVKVLNGVVSISHSATTLGKDMNSAILQAIGK